jgi:glucose-6-phosphate 1-dehydrogenase
MPAIYDLANRGLLPPAFSLVGFARRSWSREDFEQVVHDSVREHARTAWSESVWQQLVQGIRFVSGNHDDPAAFAQLKKVVDELDEQRGTAGNHTFYLSIPPRDFPIVLEQLNNSGLAKAGAGEFRRVVIEKPFGSDLKTAIELNDLVERVFPPDSVFRIDHYLGKETVQNILALRFANQLFEPIWNSEFIDHVQITMAEDIGIGGRAGYYDGIGAARDVIQNHLLQLFALTAMEQPASFNAENLRNAKEAALSDVRIPENLALYSAHGQYESGWQGGEYVNSYLEEEGTDPHSRTETFAAMRLDVDNPRWHGTPFYLRAGKRLGRRVTEIAVVFKRPSHQLFSQDEVSQLGENALVIRVQPNEGVTIRFGSKVPGPAMQVRDVTMDFGYGHAFTEDSPEAYERLILDVLLGEPPLFPRQREVELSWKILDPIVQFWESDGRNDKYAPGSWGPESAHEIMRADGRSWRRP